MLQKLFSQFLDSLQSGRVVTDNCEITLSIYIKYFEGNVHFESSIRHFLKYDST